MEFNLSYRDVVDGKAYMDEDNIVYLGNRFGDVLAFSVCGKFVVIEGGPQKLAEVPFYWKTFID